VAQIHLPPTLPQVFSDLPRTLDVEAASVGEAIDRLDARWPGLGDRLCEPGASGRTLRSHMAVFVDGERASLHAPLAPGARVDVVAAISGG
jgi:sulfur-carrier protein